MTYIAKPRLHHPTLATNKVGYTRRDYEGRSARCAPAAATTRISAAIIQACWELDIEPHRVAKLSGIGCSSKTPDYFLGASHGFNTVHGRMPSVLTGANLANRELLYLGVSGDGDSASIGLGQFAHAMRRGVRMVYIVENNGVYGLTKGQFSATADRGSKSKKGVVNPDCPVDLVGMALQLGATYVARGFSGDKAQLVPLIKGAIAPRRRGLHRRHQPLRGLQQPRRQHHAATTTCASTTRRSAASTSSTSAKEITAEPAPGEVIDAAAARRQRDAPAQAARRLRPDRPRRAHEPRAGACRPRGEVVTGLLYVDPQATDLHAALNTCATPLNTAGRARAVPGRGRAGEDQRLVALTGRSLDPPAPRCAAAARARPSGCAARSTPWFSSALDLLGVELAAQRERAAVTRALHLGMAGLHALRHGEHDLGSMISVLAFDPQVQPVLGHAGQVGVEGDAAGILDHVHGRQQAPVPARGGALRGWRLGRIVVSLMVVLLGLIALRCGAAAPIRGAAR